MHVIVSYECWHDSSVIDVRTASDMWVATANGTVRLALCCDGLLYEVREEKRENRASRRYASRTNVVSQSALSSVSVSNDSCFLLFVRASNQSEL